MTVYDKTVLFIKIRERQQQNYQSKAQATMESSPMGKDGEEKVQLQNRLTATTFLILCVSFSDTRQKLWLSAPVELCGLMSHFRV